MVAPAPIPLPEPDLARLRQFLASGQTLYQHAGSSPDPVEFLAWAKRPQIAEHLNFYRQLRRESCADRVLAVLTDFSEDKAADPVERRRAASAVLRAVHGTSGSGTGFQPVNPPTARGRKHNAQAGDRAIDLLDDEDLDLDPDENPAEAPDHISAHPVRLDGPPPPPGEVPASSRAEGALSSTSPTPPRRATTQANSAASNRSSSPSQRLTVSPPPPPPPSIPEVFHRPGGIPIPEGLPLPDPSRSPEAVFALILHHLKNPDSPVPGAGHHALLNLSAWGGPRTQEHLETEVWRWRNLLPLAVGHESATPEGPQVRSDRWLTQVFRVQKAGHSAQISLSLQRLDLGALKGCWILGQYKTLDTPPAATPPPKPRVAARFNTS